jgi:hypothetical protein
MNEEEYIKEGRGKGVRKEKPVCVLVAVWCSSYIAFPRFFERFEDDRMCIYVLANENNKNGNQWKINWSRLVHFLLDEL